jgi:hypothetical protein
VNGYTPSLREFRGGSSPRRASYTVVVPLVDLPRGTYLIQGRFRFNAAGMDEGGWTITTPLT